MMEAREQVKKRKPVRRDEPESMDTLITALAYAKMRRKQAEETEAMLTERVVDRLENVYRYKTTSGITARIIRPIDSVLDEHKLKKALGAQLFRKITVEKVDRKLLESNIAAGSIDGVVVASCMEEKPKKPYVLIDWPEQEKK